MKLKKLLTAFLVVVLVLSGLTGWGQTTLYSQNFGTGTATPSGWTIGNWTISTNTSSTTPTFSGGSNAASSGNNNSRRITFSNNISTVGYTNITILWAARRAHTNIVTCEWSFDGNTWNNLTFIDVANNLTWAWVNGGARIVLPVGAEDATDLSIRWTYDSDGTAGRYRIDDFSIEGTQITTPPPCTTPVSPANNAINFPINGNLTWNLVSGANGYRLYFGTDAAATNIVNGTDLGNVTTFNPPADLNTNTTYYWKVVPYNSFGSATGCQIWGFETEVFAYCSASSIEPTVYESITNVTFAGINNSSPVAKTVGYSNYSSTISPGVVYRGQDYVASVTEQFLATQYDGYCKIFIDFNQNGIFDLPDEYVFGNSYLGNMTMTGTISIPVTAITGFTRMRVVLEGATDNTGALPCGTFDWGEVEDYTINIISPCSNPTTGGTIATAQTICSGGDPVAFTSTAPASGESGTLEYKWQSSTTGSGSGFIDITPSATGLTYNVPSGLTQTTWYKRLSKVTCSTVWAVEGESNVLEVTVNPTPTATLSGGGTICSGASTTLSVDFTGTGPWEITTERNGAEPVTVTNISVNPYTFDVSAAGTYTISAFNDAVCDGTFSGSAEVVVNPLPTAIISNDNGPLCAGDDAIFTLTGTSGATVTYKVNSGSNQTVTLTGGTATITISNAPDDQTLTLVSVTDGTCSQSLTAGSTITVNPLPVVGSFN